MAHIDPVSIKLLLEHIRAFNDLGRGHAVRHIDAAISIRLDRAIPVRAQFLLVFCDLLFARLDLAGRLDLPAGSLK